MKFNHPFDRERGAALIISLLLLLVMTILAISISQTSTLEERMAGNARDQEVAFQGAEAGLRAAENSLTAVSGTIIAGPDLSNFKSTQMYTYAGTAYTDRLATWWGSNGVEYGTAGQDIPNLKSDPRYVVTERAQYSTSTTIGSSGSGSDNYVFYEITSRSLGRTDSSEAITQSVIVRSH